MKEKSLLTALKPNTHAKALLTIFLIALAFRLWGVTNPLLEAPGQRRTVCAATADPWQIGVMSLRRPA